MGYLGSRENQVEQVVAVRKVRRALWVTWDPKEIVDHEDQRVLTGATGSQAHEDPQACPVPLGGMGRRATMEALDRRG